MIFLKSLQTCSVSKMLNKKDELNELIIIATAFQRNLLKEQTNS